MVVRAMRALTFDPSSDRFALVERPTPAPGPRDALIRVDACGLNPVDAKICQWKALVPHMGDDWTPGLDVAGTIVQIGEEVDSWTIGDRVLCHGNMFRPHGGFAEYSLQRADALIRHPNVSAPVAAATPCAGWTAWRALVDKLRAGTEDSLVIAGGSGGVGSFAIQIARHLGVYPIIATASGRNHDYVASLGATHTIDYRTEDVVGRVHEITGGTGVTLGIDAVGPDNDVAIADCLSFEGHMVELVDVVRPTAYRDAFSRGLSFHQLSLGSGHRNGPAALRDLVAAGAAVSSLVAQGHVKTPMLKTISIDLVGDTLNAMLQRRTVGKIVMVS